MPRKEDATLKERHHIPMQDYDIAIDGTAGR
jgi:hypothetical protein